VAEFGERVVELVAVFAAEDGDDDLLEARRPRRDPRTRQVDATLPR